MIFKKTKLSWKRICITILSTTNGQGQIPNFIDRSLQKPVSFSAKQIFMHIIIQYEGVIQGANSVTCCTYFIVDTGHSFWLNLMKLGIITCVYCLLLKNICSRFVEGPQGLRGVMLNE